MGLINRFRFGAVTSRSFYTVRKEDKGHSEEEGGDKDRGEWNIYSLD